MYSKNHSLIELNCRIVCAGQPRYENNKTQGFYFRVN